ncbi:hypothetical protein [Streptosporangium vulgare]|uniref:hypothetical protein n=1 Tax=Streptosporangium vulgare TaxID=46190 RepID=UPI003CD08B93
MWISDHFHPWLDVQGQSPFVWSVIGAVAEATSLPITTAVHLPAGPHAPGDHRAGRRHQRGAVRRPVPARRRHR